MKDSTIIAAIIAVIGSIIVVLLQQYLPKVGEDSKEINNSIIIEDGNFTQPVFNHIGDNKK